jgi:sec-independent protein translocase protein TatB
VFNLQGSELIIILLLALVVLGPEKLPDAMRKAGQFYAELKKISSGFQEEFRAAVDEPMREMRDTANLLRDSADFSKLEAGERAEKPKSAEMVAAPDPDAVPVEDVPTFDSDATEAPGNPVDPVDPVDDGDDGDDGVAVAGPDGPPPPRPFAQPSSAAPAVTEPAEPAAEPFSQSSADSRSAPAADPVDPPSDAAAGEPAGEAAVEATGEEPGG